jgi:hypothetical protein
MSVRENEEGARMARESSDHSASLTPSEKERERRLGGSKLPCSLRDV